jgi:hypothetical protein
VSGVRLRVFALVRPAGGFNEPAFAVNLSLRLTLRVNRSLNIR